MGRGRRVRARGRAAVILPAPHPHRGVPEPAGAPLRTSGTRADADPQHRIAFALQIDPINGREARESGLRLKASVTYSASNLVNSHIMVFVPAAMISFSVADHRMLL